MSTEAKPVKKIPIHFQNAQNRLYIKKGRVVNFDGIKNADIYIEDGKIKYVGGADFVVPGGTRVIDASGKLIMPGGFDPNTYFDYRFDEENKSADDFYLGTKAAISGGTTTILSVVSPKKGESIMDAIYEARRNYDAKVCCDYSLIVKVDNWTKNVKDEMKMLSQKHGINAFLFQNLSDTDLFEAFQLCKELEIVPMIHAENVALSDQVYEKLLSEKVGPVEAFETSRSEQIEAEYVHRVCMIANLVEVPIYVTKVSGKMSAEQISKAKRRNNCPVYGEILTSSISSLAFKNKRICYLNNPPIRSDPETSRCLIKHLALDEVQTIASNHCTIKTDQKEKFNLKGTNGVAERLPVFFEKCVHNGMIDLSKFVAVTSTNAAKIFNLFPKKGGIYVGSDADLAIWNPEATKTISSSKDQLVFNIFDGLKLNGDVEYVIVKGRVCYELEVGLRVLEGYGNFLEISPNPSAYKKDAEIEHEEANHEDLSPHVEFEDQCSVSNESVTTHTTHNTHTARAKRPDGQRNLQASSFSVNEAENTPEAHRPGIRVRNPPGGASSVLW